MATRCCQCLIISAWWRIDDDDYGVAELMSSSMSFSLCCDCDAQTGSLSYPLSRSVGVLINERSCACVHILKQIFSAVHIIAHTIKFVFNFTQCEITLNVSIGGSCLVSVSGLSTRVIEKKTHIQLTSEFSPHRSYTSTLDTDVRWQLFCCECKI